MRVKTFVSPIILFVSIAAAVSAIPAAPPPINGTYYSTDMGGGVMAGRLSESWAGATYGYGKPGNTVLVSSIDGPQMGTQWELWCATVSETPMLLSDDRDSTGTGETAWRAEYNGGFFWMSADGPWAPPGASDYNGTIENLVSTMTFVYTDGLVVEVHAVTELSGRFDPATWDGSCVAYSINNVSYVGSTGQGPKPSDYPAFMAQDCGPWMLETGAWGDVSAISVDILDCAVTPVRKATWGNIKTMYKQ